MRILCIAPHVPWPLHGGPQLRIYHTMRVLDGKAHDVTLLAGDSEGEALPELSELDEICREIDTFSTDAAPRTRQLLDSLISLNPYPARVFATDSYHEKLADHLDKDWDLILVNHLILLGPLTQKGDVEAPIVLDQHESQLQLWREYAENGQLAQRLFALQNIPKVHLAWRRALPTLDGVICVAEEEMRELRREGYQEIPLFLAPNGVDTTRFRPTGAPPISERDPNVVFCAGMSVQRNIQAASWFAKTVFPRVRQAVPEATFWIVGANPPEEIRELGEEPGIKVTGRVPKVQPYYRKARVAVIPNRFGGFSKLKLSEAMAMGLPIVATKSGAKGAPAGEEFIRYVDTPIAFAEEVVSLLEDGQEAEDLGNRLREIAVAELSWDTIVSNLESRLREEFTIEEVKGDPSPPPGA